MRDTNDPNLRSWLEAANEPECGFPIQNLPFGVVRTPGDDRGRCAVAIGDAALDLSAMHRAGYFKGTPVEHKNVFAQPALNAFLAMGRSAWTAVRERLSALLDSTTADLRDDAATRDAALIPLDTIDVVLPVVIGDYTDFYASSHHATNVGRMFRPDGEPLLPNYKHLPVGYHGRASSVVVSGAPVRRPMGQTKADDADTPTFGPCRLLDYELEMAAVVGAGNDLGSRIDIRRWREHLFGMVLLNDWSARDVQKWEYVPLGPFNAKNFCSTISPWIVTFDALEPFAVGAPARSENDPANLPYLTPAGDLHGVTLEVLLQSKQMRDAGTPPTRVSLGSLGDMYWTVAQMLAHHTSTGCNMRPGDLLGTGTVSGPAETSRGCLLEKTWRGTTPLSLPTGEERKFLADGDTVIIRGWCERDGARRISLGECVGTVLPAE